ncbi:hypothetical protein V6N13_105281 [Hibiscus sabdariffa]|uniref:Ribosome-inactivating protein n=1 Tax=Hibiscus sabdariffa TaxID=183260 RepID=A0ABR2EWE0_9ROSI
MVSLYQHTTKVWVVLAVAVAVLWGCSISMAQPPTVRFNTRTATRVSYMYFISELRAALLANGDRSSTIPLLPDRSRSDMGLCNPRRYVMVEILGGYPNPVTFALDVTNTHVLGYGTEMRSHLFSGVPEVVRDAVFPNSQGQALPFTQDYGSLLRAGGIVSRSQLPVGITELRHRINILASGVNATTDLARSLTVIIQMIAEPARFRFMEGRIADVAERLPNGVYRVFYPDALMMAFQDSWDAISSAVQSATSWGVFPTAVRIQYGSQGEVLVFDNVASVRFLVAIMQVVCRNRAESLRYLQMPASVSFMRSTGGDDDTCDRVLSSTTHIIGQYGLCLDAHQGDKVVLTTCRQNQSNQLWTVSFDDKTIRSGGKCLTTGGVIGSNVVMFQCNLVVLSATQWEIRDDGAIRNPKTGLFLTGNMNSSGTDNIVVHQDQQSSRQTFSISNNTRTTIATITGHKGFCLTFNVTARRVWLENCVSDNGDQQWAIYTDGSIRPRRDRAWCVMLANGGGNSVAMGRCDGGVKGRWSFQNDGTILHVLTGQVMDVKDTDAPLPEIGINVYKINRFSQIWFRSVAVI